MGRVASSALLSAQLFALALALCHIAAHPGGGTAPAQPRPARLHECPVRSDVGEILLPRIFSRRPPLAPSPGISTLLHLPNQGGSPPTQSLPAGPLSASAASEWAAFPASPPALRARLRFGRTPCSRATALLSSPSARSRLATAPLVRLSPPACLPRTRPGVPPRPTPRRTPTPPPFPRRLLPSSQPIPSTPASSSQPTGVSPARPRIIAHTSTRHRPIPSCHHDDSPAQAYRFLIALRCPFYHCVPPMPSWNSSQRFLDIDVARSEYAQRLCP